MPKVMTEKQKKRAGDIVLLKDLAPRKEVKGGAGKIIFGQGADPFSGVVEEEEEKKGKKK